MQSKQNVRAMSGKRSLKQQINVAQAQGSRINLGAKAGGSRKKTKGKTLLGPPQSSKSRQSAEQLSEDASRPQASGDYPDVFEPFDAQFGNPEPVQILQMTGKVSS